MWVLARRVPQSFRDRSHQSRASDILKAINLDGKIFQMMSGLRVLPDWVHTAESVVLSLALIHRIS